MPEELPMLVLSAGCTIMSRAIGVIDDEGEERETWELSTPIPGMRIIDTWQIYHKIWLVLALAEDGKYNIFRSINLHKYSLVHSHATRIYGLYYIDDGHAVFCAADGWWATTNSGATWYELALGCPMEEPDPDPDEVVPEHDVEVPECDTWLEFPGQVVASSLAVVQLQANLWALAAYGQDHKIYYAEYPGGDFAEVYDAANAIEKWYPAIAGGPVGVLAGAGSLLLRSDDAGENWYVVQTVDGVIKGIVVSAQSTLPVFLITIEQADGESDRIYTTSDLGDSLIADITRVGPIVSAQAVVPTGSNEVRTIFAVVGRRTAGGQAKYRLLIQDGD